MILEVFIDDFSVFGSDFNEGLYHLSLVLIRCKKKNLVLNWEKCHFMVKSGIVLGHIASDRGIEVDKAKVELIAKLPQNCSGGAIFLRSCWVLLPLYQRFFQNLQTFL